MKGRIAASTLLRAVRRRAMLIAVAAAAAAGAVMPAAARIATMTPTLITIPPAKLSQRPEAPASVETASPPMAPALLPAELRILHDPQGSGLALYGALTGNAGSATGALLAMFAHSETFDPTPVSQLLLADQDDRRAQALFTAVAHGAPVIGIAVAVLDDPGGGVALLYDDAGDFPSSFPRLRQALAPSATVEIGMSDNSAYEADTAEGGNADANWDQVIAALAKGGETPIDPALAHLLTERLASDTGETWRIVSPGTVQ